MSEIHGTGAVTKNEMQAHIKSRTRTLNVKTIRTIKKRTYLLHILSLLSGGPSRNRMIYLRYHIKGPGIIAMTEVSPEQIGSIVSIIDDCVTDVILSEQDQQVEQLLDLIDEYETLRSEFEQNFKDGFFHLARANYASVGRRFGSDYFDSRNFKAVKNIKVENESEMKVVDLRDDPISINQKSIALNDNEDKFVSENDNSAVLKKRKNKLSDISKDHDNGENTDSATTTDSQVSKNVSQCKPIGLKSDRATEEEKLRDPINMFGILSPPQLKQSQKSFNLGVEQTVKLIRIQSEIVKISRALNKEKKKQKNLAKAKDI